MKKNTENILPHRFQKGISGNPNGRPRKLVTQLTSLGYKQSEVNDTLLTLLALNRAELNEVFDNPDSTILEVAIAGAMISAISKKNLYSIESILTRAMGKPREQVEMNQEFDVNAFTVRVVNVDIPLASSEADAEA